MTIIDGKKKGYEWVGLSRCCCQKWALPEVYYSITISVPTTLCINIVLVFNSITDDEVFDLSPLIYWDWGILCKDSNSSIAERNKIIRYSISFYKSKLLLWTVMESNVCSGMLWKIPSQPHDSKMKKHVYIPMVVLLYLIIYKTLLLYT